MGLGSLGRGIGDARFLAECGAYVTVTDIKSEEHLKESVVKLDDLKNIRFVLGGHRIRDFRDIDMVIKGAGVPLDSFYINEARKAGIPVRMSTALFAEMTPSLVIGVTGTKGKTTVSHLLYYILKKAGKKVFLGGNAYLSSTLAHLPESSKDELALLELDSWQLQGFSEVSMSPDLSIFTNFGPDHLNYYKGDMDSYLNDKASIFLNQKETDLLIAEERVCRMIKERYGGRIKSKVKSVSNIDIPSDWPVSVEGEHNRVNAALAVSTALSLGVSQDTCRASLAEFPGVSGRLQYKGKIKERMFYNDNNATTPEATAASVKALEKKGRIILIAGGADKDLPINVLAEVVENSVHKCLFLPGSGTERIKEMINPSKIKLVDDIEDALDTAYSISEEGDVILFSPAFASFSQFGNEYERERSFLNVLEKKREELSTK